MERLKLIEIHKRYPNRNIGFKATNHDMKCLGFQYGLGEKSKHYSEIKPCESGFHLCKRFVDVYGYYDNILGDKRFFIVEYGPEYIEEEDKIVTNELTFLEEINPLDYIQQNQDDIGSSAWRFISSSQKLPEHLIREFQDEVSWRWISEYQTLSEDFITELKDKIDWYYISSRHISHDFMRQHKESIVWNQVYLVINTIPEDLLLEFKDKVNWVNISRLQQLSEDTIRRFKDKVDWANISIHQKLSEEFIKEFQDQVDWDYIFSQQQVSKDFIKKNYWRATWFKL